jgi:uncharacterized membrane protein YbaN (DUF454 family)
MRSARTSRRQCARCSCCSAFCSSASASPATPFFLLAAACFARASARFYNWLLNNPTFGPTIVEWRRYRSIRFRTKVSAILLMASMLTISTLFFVKDRNVQIGLAALGVLLAIWMWRIPSRDRSGPAAS